MPADTTHGENWYTRSIFSVSTMSTALEYYCGLLEFKEAWNYKDGGEIIVAQVNKGGFELIMAANLDRAGQGRVFISLDAVDLDSLQRLIADKEVDSERTFWGYPIIRLHDPDGNELLFPLPAES